MATGVFRHAQEEDSLILRWVAYNRVHVIVPFVGRKNENLIDRQHSYNDSMHEVAPPYLPPLPTPPLPPP